MTASRLLAAMGLLAFFPAHAWAYIDPGSGSVLLQVLVGGLLALGVTLRMYWGRLLAMFRRDGGDEDPKRLDLDD